MWYANREHQFILSVNMPFWLSTEPYRQTPIAVDRHFLRVRCYADWLSLSTCQLGCRHLLVSGRFSSWIQSSFLIRIQSFFLLFMDLWVYKEGYWPHWFYHVIGWLIRSPLLFRGRRQFSKLVKSLCSHFFLFVCLFRQLTTILWCAAVLC